ncbi:topoisomerase II isoform X3 [Wolffia australiana]
MANDFVGSNNVNLLVPSGQFGTRLRGGKDAAHSRYIFTRLSSVTRFIFHKDDDTLLDYLNEDGQSIEPTWYVPIIPMVLVNGSEGIGTGWSSFVPNYNPRDIIANLRRLINGEQMEPMLPWYKGFQGLTERTSSREAGVTYTLSGIIEEVDSTTLRITELPVRRWTQDYKEFLESLLTGTEKIKEPFIKDYRQYSDDRTVNFEVYLSDENMKAAKEEGLLKKFKLTSTISTSNMHLFDANGIIKKYDDPEQIVEEFYHLRLVYYEKRKAALLGMLGADLVKLDNRVKFILGVVNGEIKVFKRKIAELLQELQQRGFSPLPSKPKAPEAAAGEEEEDVEEGQVSTDLRKAYAYLLSIPVESFTLEMVEKLLTQKAKLEGEMEELSATPVKSLWLRDLDALDVALDAFEKDREEELELAKLRQKKGGAARHVPAKAVAQAKPKKKAGEAAAPKPRAAAATKKAPSKRAPAKEEEEDEEILDLKERLARYDINSPPEDYVPVATVNGGDRMEEDDEAPDDEDFDAEEVNGKKKPATKKPAAAQAGPVGRRGRPAAAKKPAQPKASPEKKVRKIRPSPFNKKSGSILGRAGAAGAGSSSGESSPEVVAAPERPRPQRANRAPAPARTYLVLSDSESEDLPEEDDSDFNEDDD